MIYDIPLLRSLDPHHARLGYLGALAAVSLRSLDTYEALLARYRDLLYERFYPEDPRFERAIEHADPDLRDELRARTLRDDEENPASILAPPDKSSGWLTRSECWLYHSDMPSHGGYLSPKHAGRTIDLGRWTGVLLPTMDLSETGFLLQYLVTGGSDSWDRDRNLLFVKARPALALLYMRVLLRAEVLIPSLLCEFGERVHMGKVLATRGEAGLLRGAVSRLIQVVGEPIDPEDVLAFRELREFSDSVLRSGSTEDNYLRPRLEMLVDLGLVTRRSTGGPEKPGAFLWGLPDHTLRMVAEWEALASEPRRIDEYLDQEFMQTTGPAFGLELRRYHGDSEALLWFARAFALVRREIGFTPGRTVGLLASLLAAEAGVCLEIADVFKAVYAAPSGPYGQYFGFSGGSRFDEEFMIRVDLGILPVLGDGSDGPVESEE